MSLISTYQSALIDQFAKTADTKREQVKDDVGKLLLGAGVVAALVWLLLGSEQRLAIYALLNPINGDRLLQERRTAPARRHFGAQWDGGSLFAETRGSVFNCRETLPMATM